MNALTASRAIAPQETEVGVRGGFADAPLWPAIAAWGGGLVQLALGAGAMMTAEGGPAIRWAGLLLVAFGAAAIGWGAATLARGRMVVPRLSIAGSLAGIFAAAAALILDPARVSVFAVAAGVALSMAVALGAAINLRRGSAPSSRPDAGRRRLAGLVVAAVVVAGIVTPALAATSAGQQAVPHGDLFAPGHAH